MGWCSGTDIFDAVAGPLLKKLDAPTSDIDAKFIEEILETLFEALQWNDWDCEADSDYWEHPVVQKMVRKLYPEWFEDEED